MHIVHQKIIFLDRPHPFLEDALANMGFECHLDTESPKEIIASRISQYVGIVIRSRFRLDEHFLANASALKFIAREGVGVEHIDLDFARKRAIQVFTSPEGSMDTVAEHTIGLMLSLLNNISRADRQVRGKAWLREQNRGIEIQGKTIGLLGYGNMGQAVARRLIGFNVKVIAYDKHRKHYGDEFAREVGLKELFQHTDILSLHIPFDPDNRYFVNSDFINSFHKEIFIINTARGMVINTDDLVATMIAGQVKGAALDVLEYEDVSFNKFDIHQQASASLHYLLQSEHAIVTPHIAGWSFESKEKHARVLAGKIKAYFGL
jgi:D-3-phosphoglycerate dehydrogenase